ncbi:MAG TPA: hypothetical protein VFA46_13080 [Actinomycetes bacterium]|jgi:uncharacterized iron-regulated membrane protein|nr:hypothetical protein [Actinomycetes bacterium]
MFGRMTIRRRASGSHASELRPFVGLLVAWTVIMLALVGVLSVLHQVTPA